MTGRDDRNQLEFALIGKLALVGLTVWLGATIISSLVGAGGPSEADETSTADVCDERIAPLRFQVEDLEGQVEDLETQLRELQARIDEE